MSIFGCGHGNFMIGGSFVDTVSGLKMTCNSLDQPEYPLSHRVYVYIAFWRQRKFEKRLFGMWKRQGLSQQGGM